MSDLPAPEVPVWVRKRDGSQVPFEADKISQALFAATEALGQPDAFLAREMTDGVLSFLASEGETTLSTERIADIVTTSVAALGQPALARTFEQLQQADSGPERGTDLPAVHPRTGPMANPSHAPSSVVVPFTAQTPLEEVLRESTRQYYLQTVFARDVAALYRDGLLLLEGLETPGHLAGCVLERPALEELRRWCAGVVVLDGPEHLLARRGEGRPGSAGASPSQLVRQLGDGLQETGLGAVVNLNCAQPPSAVDDLAGGPLFAGQQDAPAANVLQGLAGEWLERLLSLDRPAGRLRLDWHLGASALTSADHGNRADVFGLALRGKPIAFVLDRPRRPVVLAEGIDRRHPAVLLAVGLHLPRLLVQTGSTDNVERFLQKLGSLARLAVSAASQKRAYLRRLPADPAAPALSQGFLLDRARLLVTPIGLDSAVRTLRGRGLCSGGAALELGKEIVQRLRDVLRQEGRSLRLEACLDGPLLQAAPTAEPDPEQVAGLTPWDSQTPRSQGRAAGTLHGVAEQGTLLIRLPADTTREELREVLRSLWEQTDVVRVQVVTVSTWTRQGDALMKS